MLSYYNELWLPLVPPFNATLEVMMTEQEIIDPAGDNAPVTADTVDWHLQELVSFATATNYEIGLTLTVGGSTISGTLISGQKYFEQFSALMVAGAPADSKDAVREYFEQGISVYKTPKENGPMPQFVHLENARVITPNGALPTNNGMLWRGKVTAISGFFLGSLSSDPVQ